MVMTSDKLNSENDSKILLDIRVSDLRIQHLLDRAEKISRDISGNRGFVWAAIGVDSTPCTMGCSFCSHAEKWNAYSDVTILSTEDIVERAGQVADQGADFVVLRTTQFYGVERLTDLGKMNDGGVNPWKIF